MDLIRTIRTANYLLRHSDNKSKTNMVKSINLSMIRGLCDELGYSSSIPSNGDLLITFEADVLFDYKIGVYFDITEQSELWIYGVADFTVKQHNVGKVLLRLNEYNSISEYMKAYLDENGQIYVDRYEIFDKEVSEDFIKQCIDLSVSEIQDFFIYNFSDF